MRSLGQQPVSPEMGDWRFGLSGGRPGILQEHIHLSETDKGNCGIMWDLSYEPENQRKLILEPNEKKKNAIIILILKCVDREVFNRGHLLRVGDVIWL